MSSKNIIDTLASLAAVAALGLLGTACRADSEQTAPQSSLSEGIDDQRLGSTMRLQGEVEKVYEHGAFRLDPEHDFSNEEVLVMPMAGRPTVVGEDDEVVVIGEVDRVSLAQLEDEYGEAVAELAEDIRGDKVLISRVVEVTEAEEDVL